jgi:2-C-methyl-D-erythritol 4-phosphate cytidylyltransferase/2-C-methyl-D-erythritol 2,4-cyclodiphosphate synthase
MNTPSSTGNGHHSAHFAAVIVAAGKGLRAGQEVPKQFAIWRGKPLLRHSAEALALAGAKSIAVAIPAGSEEIAREALAGLKGIILVAGGKTRQQSVLAALQALEKDAPDLVLIHDAARPGLPFPVVERLLAELAVHKAAIPVLPVIDSLALAEEGMMAGSAPREEMRRVQTPQAFRFPEILAAHRAWNEEPLAGDDAQVARAAGLEVALVEGDERLRKLTVADDFINDVPPVRVGTGYDVHRLAEGEELWLGGILIPHTHGLAGHSDADVAIHAAVDALLGAIGAGDIGQHFPPNEPQWRGAKSGQFLVHAAQLVVEAGYRIGNLDLTIICEAPRIGPYRDAMRGKLAGLMGVDPTCVSVKATTTERLGFTGRSEGIAAQAAVTVLRNE